MRRFAGLFLTIVLLLTGISTVWGAVDFREETIYFLMTSRFFDGDSSNNVPNEWCSYDPDNPQRQIDDPEDVTWRGDFKGLIEKLDYIKDLGFTAIWITPVVHNRGPLDYHGYHAWDFTKVDPRLESPGATFQDLINEIHARDMKLVLDVVFNHSGRFGIKDKAEIKYNTDPTQPWGQDSSGSPLQTNPDWEYDGLTPNPEDGKIWSRANVAKLPAPYNQDLSQHNWPSTVSFVDTTDPDWYHHSGNGFAQGWDDTENLYNRALAGDCPDLNTESQQVREYLVDAYKKYIDMGVDAMRVDTVKHMARPTVQYFVDALKNYKPDLFMFGEVAQKRHELHNVEEINPHWYTWRGEVGNSENSGLAVIDFYAQASFHNTFEDGGNFSGVMAAARYDHLYSDPSYNLTWLDNHDFGPNNDWNRRFGGSAENLAASMNFMFTWRGIPIVYYGTEVQFMKGAYADIHEAADIEKSIDLTGRAYYGDQFSSAPNHVMYKHIKKLNAIRKAVPALQKGSWYWAGNGGSNGVGFVREYNDSYVVVGLAKDGSVDFNFSGVADGVYRDAVTGNEITVSGGNLSFTVGASSAGIYVLNGPGMIGNLGAGFFQTDSSGNGGGGGGSSDSVEFSPETPVIGQDVTITYTGFLKDRDSVTLYWSYDGWSGDVTETPMTQQADGSWQATVTVPETASRMFDCVFHYNKDEWDNNNSNDYHATLTSSPLDTVAPVVSWSTPGSGASLSGQVSLAVSASDNVAMDKVEFYAGTARIGTATSSPWSISIDSATLANGSVTLKALAYDTSANTAEDAVAVNIANDKTDPEVSISLDPDQTTVGETITVSATASDNVAVTAVRFLVDGNQVGEDTSSPWAFSLDTSSLSDGDHTLKLIALDAAGNSASASRSITVDNESSDEVNWTVHYFSSASANVFIQYKTGSSDYNAFPGAAMSKGSAGWYTWQGKAPEGTLSMRFILSGGRWDNNSGQNYSTDNREAWIKAGTVHTSEPPAEDSSDPEVSLTGPADGSTVQSSISFTAAATDNVGVERVDFLVNGNVVAADSSAPYAASWSIPDTLSASATLSARAYDAAGNTDTDSVSVSVDNSGTDNPPSISAFNVPDSPVSGSITLGVDASDDHGIAEARFLIDAEEIAVDSTAPYEASLDTRSHSNGEYTVTVVVQDTAGQTVEQSAVLAVNNPTPGTVRVHYKSSWVTPYMHYNNGTAWTDPPGEAMDDEGSGWYVLDVEASGSLTFAFNDGADQWDNNGGDNYTTSLAEVWVQDGQILSSDPDGGNNTGETTTRTVHYKTTWTSPNMHYNNGTEWTASPGEAMESEGNSWYKLSVEASGEVTVCFNDGSGTWDSNGGDNYSSSAAEFWISDGQLSLENPDGPQPPSLGISQAGGYFTSDTLSLSLQVNGEELQESRYTIDGSDPANGIPFTSGTDITIGADMQTNESLTLKMMAVNPYGTSSKEYTFTKVDEIPVPDFSWDNATVYFVLTDRFQDGNAANNTSYGRPHGTGTGDWHGGDLAGLTQKLNENYFTDLGVNAIWISCPFEQIHGWVVGGGNGFKHYAYHGYYIQDFTMLDNNMGTTNELKTFIDTAHEKGIRVVFDIVMNHSGYNTMSDMDEYQFGELYSGWENATTDNYHDLINYDSSNWVEWWGPDWIRAGLPGYDAPGGDDQTKCLSGLPDFKTESTQPVGLPKFYEHKTTRAEYIEGYTVRDYLIKWITDWVRDYGVDGFRVDTAKHVGLDAWQELKSEAVRKLRLWKEANPDKKVDDLDFWMTGEVWGHGVGRSSYFDNGFDSVINFSFQGAAAGALNDYGSIENIYSGYASSINSDPSFNALSYLSSHDTELFYNAYAGASPEAQKRAGTLLLLTPGGVQIYYGDENARELGPHCSDEDQRTRSDMPWPGNEDVLAHWQKIGQFRNRHIAIGAGQHEMLSSSPYTFKRSLSGDIVVCALGASGSTTVDVSSAFADGTTVRDYYSGNTATVSGGTVTFTADPNGILLLEKM